jgi:predicted DNA-binding WGR domain protein
VAKRPIRPNLKAPFLTKTAKVPSFPAREQGRYDHGGDNLVFHNPKKFPGGPLPAVRVGASGISPGKIMKSTTLYFREGGSDKVYQAAIEPRGPLFVVTFAFGRRGSTLQTGVKTPTPTDLSAAERIFEKLVREKTAKGYARGTPSPLMPRPLRRRRASAPNS